MANPTGKTSVASSSISQPRISLDYVSAPVQRLYVLSFGALLQAIKARCFLLRWFFPEYWWRYLFTWLAIDAAFVVGMAELRIPRLAFNWKARLVQILLLGLIDIALFKPYEISVPWTWIRFSSSGTEISTREKSVHVEDVINHGGHLFGQHTVRLSPISTAKLNPLGKSFCLQNSNDVALIPIVFNNTRPTQLTYSISSLSGDSLFSHVTLSGRELRQIEKTRADALLALKNADPEEEEDNEDDYYEYNEQSKQHRRLLAPISSPEYDLEKTEILQHIRITKPGVVRLEKAIDQSDSEVRMRPAAVTVVDCPRVEFVIDESSDGRRCVGASEKLDLKVYGVPPLTLKWQREVSGRQEIFLVEGIEGKHAAPGRLVAEELRIPLDIQLDALGKHTYTLDALTDGVGNSLDLSSVPSSVRGRTSQSLTVLRRSAMSFRDCGPGRPTGLLIGKETPISIVANDADYEDGPWNITIKYRPPLDDKKKYKPWQQDFRTGHGKRELTLMARAPGEYTIVNIQGKYCPGDVLSPETCRVVEQPLPTAVIEWKRIHECSGDTGVSASLVLQGKAPFKVFYRTRRDGEPTRELHQTFHGSRGEITLQPERSGSYTYTFVRMSDANYEDVKLDGPTINQVVHPLAAADFVTSAQMYNKQVLHSCSGSMVDIDVELKGTPPWNMEVQILGPKAAQTVEVRHLNKTRETLRLPIPSVIDEEGGTFQVDLVSIEDTYGCKRLLSIPGISVNVKRVKPTAKFYAQDGKRQINILQGKSAQLPLRLTGDGPWKIKYRKVDDPEAGVSKVSLSTPNDKLVVSEAGLYEIVEVNDTYCPGFVIEGEETYLVEWIPRPSVQIARSIDVEYISSNGTFVRPGVCEGTDDYIDLVFHGVPPFQINYNIARETNDGGIRLIDQPSFSSIQSSSYFQLQTSTPGRVYYEITAVGDALYPVRKNAPLLPISSRLQFEQQVFPRPTAFFKRSDRVSYCLHDTFVHRGDLSTDGTVVLTGTPPFILELSVKNLASSEVHKEVVETFSHEWKLDIPHYIFRTVGPHLVIIDSIRDASNCPHSDLDVVRRQLWIDVAESAVIVPFDRREDYCVGEALQFQLEGTPPWRIQYRFDGKLTSAHAAASPFRRVADRAGIFSIVSIAHEQDRCQNTIADLSFRIHNIPSAKVSHGKRVVENIREGEQAEIHFELIGDPPFTFTYQRTELASQIKRGITPKVLETHTVSGITTKDYSIYSAAEGTWTVTFIQDKYCRYPPVQADKAIENA